MSNCRVGFEKYMENVREKATKCSLKPTGSITC